MSKKDSWGRREFLGMAAGSSAGLWLAGCAGSESGQSPGPSTTSLAPGASTAAPTSTPATTSTVAPTSTRAPEVADRVIVIGAGVAGLTIANALTTAGVDTAVLEGRNRLGGRVYSPEVGGVPVDVGGMWISGPEGNPATCILNQEGLGWTPSEQIDVTTRGFDSVLGRAMTDAETFGAAPVIFEFEAELPALSTTLGPTATMAEAAELFMSRSTLTGDARRHAEFLLVTYIELLNSIGMDRLPIEGFLGNPSSPLPGGEFLPDGSYRGLVDALARSVDVQLDTIVSRIAYDADGVTVETSQGTERGSHVVVTVPLGVLKHGSIEFSPPLPEAKQSAIGRLDMAEAEKVVLTYDDAFWPDPGLGNFAYLSETPGEFPFIVDYTAFAGGTPTLVGFYLAGNDRSIANRSDDAIAGRLAEIAGEISGVNAGAGAPTPTDVHVTRWKSDPFAMGSYIYLPAGSSAADIEALAAPVNDRLLFAGDSTSLEHNGYVHGAILTGIREAERLLDRQGQGVELDSGLVIKLGCDEQS